MTLVRTLIAASFSVLFSACASTHSNSPAPLVPKNLAETLATTPQLSSLSNLVAVAGLTDALKAPGPFTIFAPTNEAIAALPQKTRDSLVANPDQLRAVLSFHVIPAKVMAAQVSNAAVKSLNGAMLPVAKAGNIVTVDDAMVAQADIQATNGVIHTIDRVVMPPAPRR